jgi:hypothetical protein
MSGLSYGERGNASRKKNRADLAAFPVFHEKFDELPLCFSVRER